MQDVEKVTAGNIAVLSGLKSTVTGDTLVKSESSAKKAAKRHHASKHDSLDSRTDLAAADELDVSLSHVAAFSRSSIHEAYEIETNIANFRNLLCIGCLKASV